MPERPTDPVFDWGSVPLTRQETRLLDLYGTDAAYHGFDTYCGTCPRIHNARASSTSVGALLSWSADGRDAQATCCRDEPEPTPCRVQKLKERLRFR